MTATTAQIVQHEPWCTDHETDIEWDGVIEWCRHPVAHELDANGQHARVVIIERHNATERVGIYAHVTSDPLLTPAEAREVAAALLSTAIIVEEAG